MGKFEKFIYKRVQSFGQPTVTLTKVGIINFNSTTMEKYVKDNTYAILFYNKKDSLIGIQFSNNRTPEAYKVKNYRNGKFGTISGMAFLKYYRILNKETRSYSVEWSEQDEMLIIDLKQHKKTGVSKNF